MYTDYNTGRKNTNKASPFAFPQLHSTTLLGIPS